jgi:hypothetical protein
MPATFPSHQAAILPLKLWRPRWFDGVALAVGAASPDVAYLLDGTNLPVWPFSHEWLGLVGWCLPVTVVIAWLFRLAAPAVAAHLPNGGALALRDYGALAPRNAIRSHRDPRGSDPLDRDPRQGDPRDRDPGEGDPYDRDPYDRDPYDRDPHDRDAYDRGARDRASRLVVGHRWWITASSAVLGGASHLVLDHFGDVNPATEYTLHAIGALVTLAVLLEIGRSRLIRRWHGLAPQVARRPALFWGVAAGIFVTGAVVVPFLPAAFLAHTTGARLIAVVAAALLAGAVVVPRRIPIVGEAG